MEIISMLAYDKALLLLRLSNGVGLLYWQPMPARQKRSDSAGTGSPDKWNVSTAKINF